MTTGASNDIEQATNIARHMVVDFGMTSLGPINWTAMDGERPWNRFLGDTVPIGPNMQSKIDNEVHKIIDTCYKEARKIIGGCRRRLDVVAKLLLEKETLEREDFEKLVGKKPSRGPAFALLKAS